MRTLIFVSNFSEKGRGTYTVSNALRHLPNHRVLAFDLASRTIARGPLRTPLTMLQLALLLARHPRAAILVDTRRGFDLLGRTLRFFPSRPFTLRFGNILVPQDLEYAAGSREGAASRMIPRAIRVFVPSEAAREALIALLQLDPARVQAIYNGADYDVPEPARWQAEQRLNLLFLGRLDGRKRPELAVETLAALVDAGVDATLTLMGSGDAAALRERADALGVADRLEVTGFVSSPWQRIAPNTILFHPARTEGFGYAVLEAIARAVPCVAIRGSGGPEEVIAATGGGVVAPADPLALAGAVRDLVADRSALAARMERASAIAATRFSAARMAADYDAALLALDRD